jgi:hypothetical protein
MGHGQGYEETNSSRGLVGLDLTPRHPDSSLLCLHHVVTLGHLGTKVTDVYLVVEIIFLE